MYRYELVDSLCVLNDRDGTTSQRVRAACSGSLALLPAKFAQCGAVRVDLCRKLEQIDQSAGTASESQSLLSFHLRPSTITDQLITPARASTRSIVLTSLPSNIFSSRHHQLAIRHVCRPSPPAHAPPRRTRWPSVPCLRTCLRASRRQDSQCRADGKFTGQQGEHCG
jgi:hypothetical protein